MQHLTTVMKTLTVENMRIKLTINYPELGEKNIDFIMSPRRSTRMPSYMVEPISQLLQASNPDISCGLIRSVVLNGTSKLLSQNLVIDASDMIYSNREYERVVGVLSASSLEDMAKASTNNSTVSPIRPESRVADMTSLFHKLPKVLRKKPTDDKGDE